MLGIGLKLLGIGKGIVGWIAAGVAWLFDDWRRVAIAVALGVVLFIGWHIRTLNGDLASQTRLTAKEAARADKAEANFALLKEQHYSFVADVQAKTEEAERLDKANVARVEREMQQIKERTAHEYEDRIADTGGALDRLRDRIAQGVAAGSQSHGSATDMPDHYAARCAAFGYASCDALLTALPELLAAAEDNTSKLTSLQEWARSILAIDLDGNFEVPSD